MMKVKKGNAAEGESEIRRRERSSARKEAIRRREEKEKDIPYCCLFDALRVSPLRCVQTDCFAEPVSFSHDDYSGQGLYVLSMMRATEEVLSPAREDCIP